MSTNINNKKPSSYWYVETTNLKIDIKDSVINYQSQQSNALVSIPFSLVNRISIYDNRIVVDYKTSSRLRYLAGNKEIKSIVRKLCNTTLRVVNRS